MAPAFDSSQSFPLAKIAIPCVFVFVSLPIVIFACLCCKDKKSTEDDKQRSDLPETGKGGKTPESAPVLDSDKKLSFRRMLLTGSKDEPSDDTAGQSSDRGSVSRKPRTSRSTEKSVIASIRSPVKQTQKQGDDSEWSSSPTFVTYRAETLVPIRLPTSRASQEGEGGTSNNRRFRYETASYQSKSVVTSSGTVSKTIDLPHSSTLSPCRRPPESRPETAYIEIDGNESSELGVDVPIRN